MTGPLRGKNPPHAYWCRVDGGTYVHGKNGFHCPRCAQLAEEDVEYGLLAALDKYTGGVR